MSTSVGAVVRNGGLRPRESGGGLASRRRSTRSCRKCREAARGRNRDLISRARKRKTSSDDGSIKTRVEEDEKEKNVLVEASLALIMFYRKGISPLLPPSCRYIPTCSQYALDSYRDFGFVKGSVLTAWRIFRCNPWGGSGYDPPQWPPVWR